jgi:hypothetical protein
VTPPDRYQTPEQRARFHRLLVINEHDLAVLAFEVAQLR